MWWKIRMGTIGNTQHAMVIILDRKIFFKNQVQLRFGIIANILLQYHCSSLLDWLVHSLLERVDEQLPHLESKWNHSLRQFLSSISASIHLDDPSIPQPQRVNDQYLVDMIIHSNRYSLVQLRTLNYCRLYLQAVTFADITKPNGLHLDRSFFTGHLSLYSSRTRWHHSINQDRPSDKEWRLWKSANWLWSDQSGVGVLYGICTLGTDSSMDLKTPSTPLKQMQQALTDLFFCISKAALRFCTYAVIQLLSEWELLFIWLA